MSGKTDGQVRKARCGLFALFGEARDALHVSDPSALTAAHIDTAAQHMRAPQRDTDLTKVAGLKKVIGKATGDWAHPVIRLVVDTLEARRPVPGVCYLTHRLGSQDSVNTLAGFLEALKSHEFGNEWSVFFHWYLEYSSLDWRAIDARPNEFPPRPPSRELAIDAFQMRMKAARAYLAAARSLYPDRYWELSPKEVFGPMYRELTGAILKSWELAAETPHSVSHRASAGLHHLVCSGGMIARALFDLDVHCRAPAPANKVTTNTSARAFVDRERVKPDRTSIEVSLLDAYDYSRTVCLNLQGERLKCPKGSGINTVKDLRKAIHETPFWKFQHAQHELLRQVERHIANGTALKRAGLGLTVATLVHGILVSGGCRRSEICHLREGLQTHLAKGIRLVTLRAADRKNDKMHPFALRDLWLPDWFLQHYLNNVRPVINRHDITDPSTPPFLVLNPHAKRPYGCPEELPDGSSRDTIKSRNNKKQISQIWRKNVALEFVALQFEVPFEPHQFGMHIVRNVGGHAVFVTKGLQAAAHFLGDSVGTVEGVYAALKGELVDTSLLVGP